MKKMKDFFKRLFRADNNNGTCEESMFGFDLFSDSKESK